MAAGIRLLHVDDDASFADLTATYIERENDGFSVETVYSASAALDRLSDDIDCVVSDYEMPGMDGIELLTAVRSEYPDLPFILFTGKGSEAVAGEAISAGVTDYLQKQSTTEQYELLVNRIRNGVDQYATERERQQWRRAVETATEGIAIVTDDGAFRRMNDAYAGAYGERPEALVGTNWRQWYPDAEVTRFENAILPELYDTGVWEGESVGRRADGTEFEQHLSMSTLPGDGHVCVMEDITERKRRERERERSQTRYRSLFEYNPLILWEEDFSAVMESLDELSEEVSDVEAYLKDNPAELDRLISQIEIIDINRNALEYYDAPSKEVLLDSLDTIFTAEARKSLAAEFAAFADGATQFRRETVAQTIHGEEKHELLEAFVPEEFADTYSRVYVSSTDITDRKERERELEATQRRLDAILEHTTMPMFMKDDEGRYIFANRGYKEVFDIEGEVAGKTAHDVHPPDHAERIEADDRTVLETGTSLEYEDRVTTDDGTRTFLLTVVPIYGTDEDANSEDPVALFGVASDITDLKRRETELERERDRLEEFTSIVSHDLRSPLNVASGHLELAREECGSDHLEDAAGALERMGALIDDLLTLAREGEPARDHELVSLADLGDACWETVETEQASLTLDTDLRLRADRSRLQQLFENLMRNAVEHGGEDVAITIGDTDGGFFLADDGPGISKADRETVFEVGYSTTADGTGFGLNIVREIVDAHGWEVDVTASEAGGARFDITGVETVSEDS